jgi:hypothetical protein
MGPKLFAAFGAGIVVATTMIYLVTSPQSAPPAIPAPPAITTPVIPTVVPPAAPEPAKPIAKTPAARPRPTKRPKKFITAQAAKPEPQPAPITVDSVEIESVALPQLAIEPETPTVAAFADSSLPPREPLTVTLPEGTLLQVRLGERLASDRNIAGDAFLATLEAPLTSDGWVIADRGARVLGRVVDADPAGRIQGTALLTLELSTLTADDGQKIAIRTARFVRKGDTSRKEDAIKVGAGAAIGAVIGAIAGGGKGAAIGAASGGAAGTGVILATRGKAAVLEAETRLTFRLDRPVTVTERR